MTQSGRRTTAYVVGCAAAAMLAGLGGCGMPSLTSGIGGGWFGGQNASKGEVAAVNEEQLLAAAKTDTAGPSASGGDVAHGCPRFRVWSRDGYVTIYEAGRVGDSLAVKHRGEITQTARECYIEPGRITVKYGFSGRVLLGPKGKAGLVALPVNVFVTDAKRDKVATEKVRVDAGVDLEKPIGYFSVVRTISFSIPEGSRPAEYEVYVAFDRNVPGAG